jgi:hypothetical protein
MELPSPAGPAPTRAYPRSIGEEELLLSEKPGEQENHIHISASFIPFQAIL